MQNARREIQKLLKNIPDNASYENIQYRIYVRQKIAQGEADVEAGRVLTQEEAEQLKKSDLEAGRLVRS